ncbi:MAG: hypothetical protein II008_06160 [Oscillospiraceae bacterium]|jgi:hypothetical protein|nr:hypothetical protein [Oscillospiraceae bacterium]
MSNQDANIMDWDSAIEDDGQGGFILLEEGDYEFTVSGLERARHLGSAKIPACNKAILTLSITTPNGVAQVKTSLLLYKTVEWKLSSFFRSIGQKKHGERLVPKWDQVLGSVGHAHIIQRTFTGNDGLLKKTNDVDYFIDYVSSMHDQDDDIPF